MSKTQCRFLEVSGVHGSRLYTHLLCSWYRSVWFPCKINAFRDLVMLLTMQEYGAFVNASFSATQQEWRMVVSLFLHQFYVHIVFFLHPKYIRPRTHICSSLLCYCFMTLAIYLLKDMPGFSNCIITFRIYLILWNIYQVRC